MNSRIDPRTQVLVVEDEALTRAFLRQQLEKAQFNVLVASNGEEALGVINENLSVALLDLKMPKLGGIECLKQIRSTFPDVECLIVTGSSDVGDAVEAMKSGAYDYILKPINPDELVSQVQKAARTVDLKRENRQLRHAVGSLPSRVTFVGDSTAAKNIRQTTSKVAGLDWTVLISGESGVGKGLVARMIHYSGPRAHKPFVTVSCTALPRDLVEAELFGHEKGAFTGAFERRPGRIEMADGGTLFLDEIGDMPIDLQPKLLNFLQDRAFHRIGGTKTTFVNVRIIAATNQNLQQLCKSRQFREDLYFRLNVLPVHIPPLRERREDIRPFAEFVLARIADERESAPLQIDDSAWAALMNYHWPGNVRELENVVERATAFCHGSRITADDLPAELTDRKSSLTQPNGSFLAGMAMSEIERLAIIETLKSCQGNKAEAARRLGLSKKSIYNKMKRLDIPEATGRS